MRSPWVETGERTKRANTRKAKQAVSVLLGEIAPNKEDRHALTSSSNKNSERNNENVDESLMKALALIAITMQIHGTRKTDPIVHGGQSKNFTVYSWSH